MRNSILLVTLLAMVTLAVAVLSAQSPLDQLKAYTESAPAPAKGAPATTGAVPVQQGKAAAAGLPDIIGIRLGMPLREAFTILQTTHPSEKLGTSAISMPGIEKPVLSDFFFPISSSGQERVDVYMTPPPNQQVVWKVKRQLARQKIYRANLISSLREKYGKEAATSPLVANDQQLTDMWWVVDEQGRPSSQQPYANGRLIVNDCLGPAGSWFAPDNLERMLANPDLKRDWCDSYGIGIHASISYGAEITSEFAVEIFHYPLAMRSAKAETTFVNDAVKRQQQQQINQFKQAKPKL